MESSTDYNSILETLHRMHHQFADLMEQVNGGVRRIRGTEQRISEMKAIQDEALKVVLNQRIALDQKQAQLDENEHNIATRKKQLDEAKNEREFNRLRDQIAAAEAANAVLSDEILEGLDYLDELKQKAEIAKQNLLNTEALLADMRAKTQEVREQAENEIRRIKVDFREMEGKLDGDHRMMYQRLFNLKKFDSLAPISGQCCSGCHTALPVDQIARIVSGKTAVACPLCGRMLYSRGDYHI